MPRTRLAALLAAAMLAFAVPACGDDDGQGIEKGVKEGAKEVEKQGNEIEKGVRKGAKEVERQGNEIDDDLKGRDETRQKDK